MFRATRRFVPWMLPAFVLLLATVAGTSGRWPSGQGTTVRAVAPAISEGSPATPMVR